MWNAKYEVVRSTRDGALHMIFAEGKFSEIPDRDRRLGPWRPLSTGSIADLKPQYRVQIATVGYVMVRQLSGSFSAEPRQTSRATPAPSQRSARSQRGSRAPLVRVRR